MASNDAFLEIIYETLWAMEFGRRFALAALALFAYDHVVTFDKEVL